MVIEEGPPKEFAVVLIPVYLSQTRTQILIATPKTKLIGEHKRIPPIGPTAHWADPYWPLARRAQRPHCQGPFGPRSKPNCPSSGPSQAPSARRCRPGLGLDAANGPRPGPRLGPGHGLAQAWPRPWPGTGLAQANQPRPKPVSPDPPKEINSNVNSMI